MPPSPIQQRVHFTGGAGTFHDGGHLRNAHTGHDARGADGAGPDAHLHGVGAGLQHGAGAFIGRHVARDELAIRERALDGGHGIQNVLGVAVRGVEHEHVNARGDEGGGALLTFRAHADGRADAQAALLSSQALGYFWTLSMSFMVRSPASSPFSSTTSSFSMRWVCRWCLASSSVVRERVIRFSMVITSRTLVPARSSTKRTSRLVRMPTSFFF